MTYGAEQGLRGYTGHEHLTEFGLINMNARLYDPILGRFLGMDPYVQLPDYTQNFNRYAYALNNPLLYVDPEGEFIVAAILACVAVTAAVTMGGVQGAMMANMSGAKGWKKFGYIFGGMAIGAVSVGVGAGAGAAISTAVTGASVFLSGAAIGATGGAAGGFVGSAGNAWLGGASFGQGLKAGVMYQMWRWCFFE